MISVDDRQHIDAIRQDRSAFDAALAGAGSRAKGKTTSCPWHDDQNPSASILEAADGSWRVYCHVCDRSGDVFDLRELASGRSVADQLRELRENEEPTKAVAKVVAKDPPVVYPTLEALTATLYGVVEGVYRYTNPGTKAVELVIFRILPRDGKKRFSQASPCEGGWIKEACGKPWPLYNRTRLQDASVIVVVEGEKVVHALNDIGIIATTAPCGAGKGKHADWTPLAGKRVVLWPDFDDIGAEHMVEVRGLLEQLPHPPQIALIDPAGLGLPPKGDAYDFIARLGSQNVEESRAIVQGVLDDAQQIGAHAEVERQLEDVISGKRRAISWPWMRLTAFARALLPGTVTILCGDPGCGKSLMALEAAAHWHNAGESIAVFELEEDRTYHLNRAVAQRSRNSSLLDLDWIEGHHGAARSEFSEHRNFSNSFGRCISDAPEKAPTLKDMAKWVEDRCDAGIRVVVIDPITAAAASDKPWIDDLAFMMRVKSAARKSGASIVLATHPKKGNKGRVLGLDDLAGSAAFQRFAQTVLWLQSFETESFIINGRSELINRSIAVLKARNGTGHCGRIGFYFDSRSLLFHEVGVIEPEENRKGKRT